LAKQLDPHLGIELFALQASQRSRRIGFESTVRAHEVVEGHEECGQGNDPIEVLEAGTWPGMELVGAVESLDQLLEGPVLLALLVEVSQADNGTLGEHILVGVFAYSCVVCNHGAIVRGQSVGDQFSGLALR